MNDSKIVFTFYIEDLDVLLIGVGGGCFPSFVSRTFNNVSEPLHVFYNRICNTMVFSSLNQSHGSVSQQIDGLL